jgi:hypothetical protein
MSLAAELAVMGAGVFAAAVVLGGANILIPAGWRLLGLLLRRR